MTSPLPMHHFGSRSLLDPPKTLSESEEHKRLAQCEEGKADWKRWGPYVSERQWGTCREDYGTDGNSWAYFGFHQAHQVAYRWGEDGLAGFCDIKQHLCLSLGLWNGADPILKERIFGLGGPQGNHGEDVKDMYYYLDATPTNSYLKMLYKYPQKVFPYDQVRRVNAGLGNLDEEYELMDTGIFDEDRYFDVFVEYGRGEGEDDVLMRVTAINRGPEEAELHLMPQAFFRNTWSWSDSAEKPKMERADGRVDIEHAELGKMYLYSEDGSEVLLCENETSVAALAGDDAGLRPFDFAGDADYDKADQYRKAVFGTGTGFGTGSVSQADPSGALYRKLVFGCDATLAAADEDGEHNADDLYEAFVTCNVVRSKDTWECKGYCFLMFDDPFKAEEAILLLNAGVDFAGEWLEAQLSQPKQRHGKNKEAVQLAKERNEHDLRLRRQRYHGVSKHASMGHTTCSDSKATITGRTGKVNGIGGTRGGKPLVLDDGRLSSRSGFVA
mmetsp:Transcript_3531/g.9486  ORF Transcript_3531/g.9486 Transcript_3531/m.9486 type:complete len:499 (+) Transcript_3531:140-1636(+)